MDQLIRSPRCSRALSDGPLLGSPARERDGSTRPATLPTWRIRPGRPGGCDLGDLESPPASIHAANHSLGRSAVPRLEPWPGMCGSNLTAGSRPAQLGTAKESGATPEIWRFSYSRWDQWLKSYWTDLRRWPHCKRSSSSFGEASTPQSNRSACGCGRRCGNSLPNFWPASRLFPGGVPTDHRNQLAAWLPRNGPDGTYARARRISLSARVLSAVGEADGSGGCMFGVVANHRRRRTQLSYGKCRRSDNFAGPAESASSYQRGSTRSYLVGIGLRCFSALPGDPATATGQGNKLGTQQLNPSLRLF